MARGRCLANKRAPSQHQSSPIYVSLSRPCLISCLCCFQTSSFLFPLLLCSALLVLSDCCCDARYMHRVLRCSVLRLSLLCTNSLRTEQSDAKRDGATRQRGTETEREQKTRQILGHSTGPPLTYTNPSGNHKLPSFVFYGHSVPARHGLVALVCVHYEGPGLRGRPPVQHIHCPHSPTAVHVVQCETDA